ncbi:MAG TPA: hypothetical protein VMM18_13285 [Gemmatimonadaceae bacterium]|nr:hypothetical protein [Gemmatimonadaceae bacterium]
MTIPLDRALPNRRRGALACAAALVLTAGCATGAAGTNETTEPRPDAGVGAGADTAALVPPGFGTLRQDDLAIRVQLRGMQVRAIPLDESIIRVLSPDSYRALRDLLESRRADIATIASRYGLRRPAVWYVSYFGIEPEARFSPMDFIVTSAGRDHRPLEVLPLSPGFGEHRLRQRETQTALYVFEDGVDPGQPLVVSVEGERNRQWEETLRRIEREWASIRSRAAARHP